MERTISQEERIRRAEEIYQRRRNQGVRVTGNTVNLGEKKDLSLFKKMAIKIIICSIIYSVFYVVKNSNYIFSQDVLSKTNEILSYDMNIEKYLASSIDYIKNFNIGISDKDLTEDNPINTENTNIDSSNNVDVQSSDNVETMQQQDSNPEEKVEENISEDNSSSNEKSGANGVGGGNEIELVNRDEQENKSQMEQDATYIKENYSMIIPVNGVITSGFGPREPDEIVSANHAGIDIGADIGTKITASMTGIVTEVSGEGDYGNHVKITNGNVTTVYAHCNSIYVTEGEEVTQGREIAEVGETGRATGPHLHFEIRVDGRLVDPEYILQF